MNRKALLQNALNAVNYKKAEATHQLKQVKALQMVELTKYWTQQVEEHEATYNGLLAMLLEVDHEQP